MQEEWATFQMLISCSSHNLQLLFVLAGADEVVTNCLPFSSKPRLIKQFSFSFSLKNLNYLGIELLLFLHINSGLKLADKPLLFFTLGPGISSYAGAVEKAGVSLKHCMDWAKEIVPQAKHHETPVYLGATAGMRLLRYETKMQTTLF